MAKTDSLRTRLEGEIATIIGRKSERQPLVLWCDPESHWHELLKAIAKSGDFELWDDEQHELVLRERLLAERLMPTVVWLPHAQSDLTYLKVIELQADEVWKESLISALTRYGVQIPREDIQEVTASLPIYALEWLDRALSEWKGLPPSAIVSDRIILEALSRAEGSLEAVVGAERISIFERRVTDEFGLPAVAGKTREQWRIAAAARLLVTDAAAKNPSTAPSDKELIIPPGSAREQALRLLDQWQKNVEFMAAFEEISIQADATTALKYWAKNLHGSVPALASPAAEEALFSSQVEELAKLEMFQDLATRLSERAELYEIHSAGFWSKYARNKISWQSLCEVSRAASVLSLEATAENDWKTPNDAVRWFTTKGWEADLEGESLLRSDQSLPSALLGVRARLRRAYLHHVDRVNRNFSELLVHHGVDSVGLPFAGQLLAEICETKDAVAVIVLDACRFDLGARIAARLNQGETKRASVSAARAPLPSITALGMPFALAEDPSALSVQILPEGSTRWKVTERNGKWNLCLAEDRRQWLRQTVKVKASAITDTKTVLDAPVPRPKDAGRLLFVFGDEFDKAGHEGELQFTGADEYLDWYSRAVLKLRDAGYTTVAIVTDHGFIHWQPEKDEIESKPDGDRLWESRRSVVGHNLSHATAIRTVVPQSDLECCIPRSVNAFKAYGGIGFFHGGTTLQELVIPVVKAHWPKKIAKIAVVLTPLTEITSLSPRVEVRPGLTGLPGLGADPNALARDVEIKVVESATRRRLMESTDSARMSPEGEPATLILHPVENETWNRGIKAMIEARDASNDEILDHCEIEMKIERSDWD